MVYFAAMLVACGSSEKTVATTKMDGQNLTVTSENLNNGKWDEIISNTRLGENLSPQLSWSSVNGAGCYAVIMIDPDGNNWLHWIETDITDNELPQGFSSEDKYVGPYPPSGTHRYQVYSTGASLRQV